MISYTLLPKSLVSDADLAACADLFSQHYGVWGPQGPRPHARVRLSADKLREQFLFNDQCSLAMAKHEGRLVGHVFVTKFEHCGGIVSWVTQLVVHSDFRSRGIASALCHLAWDVTREFAAGLVSSHPHAVRALQRATRRRCDPALIAQHAEAMLEASRVPYLQGRPLALSSGRAAINTEFFVDHTEANRLVATSPGWRLGSLGEGEEYLAATFACQSSGSCS